MGLDIVEIVMATEEQFRINIPDKEAETLETIGQLRDCVCRHLSARGDDYDPGEVLSGVMDVVAERSGYPRHTLTENMYFVKDLHLD